MGWGMIIFDNRMMRREDHLAVVKEYGGICEELRAAIYGGQEQIASLQAKLAEKEEMIAYNQGCYDDAIGEYRLEEQDLRRAIAQKDARIKELEQREKLAARFAGRTTTIRSADSDLMAENDAVQVTEQKVGV
jgi:hypothetical protein